MTARLASIQRHPLKSHGRETLAEVRLAPGRAVEHRLVEIARHDRHGWRQGARERAGQGP